MSRIFTALCAWTVLLGCPQRPATQEVAAELQPIEGSPERESLLAAGEGIVQSGDPEAPIRLEKVWRWTPPDGAPLLIWSLCQGEMDAQGCYLFIGKPEAELVVLARSPIGWEPPKLSVVNGAVIIHGEDGRSSFRRELSLAGGRPVIGEAQRPEGS